MVLYRLFTSVKRTEGIISVIHQLVDGICGGYFLNFKDFIK